MSEVKSSEPTLSRRGYGRGIGRSIQKIMAPFARKQGFGAATLLTHWSEIIGTHYASVTTPLKITYLPQNTGEGETPTFEGTVHIAVQGPSVALTLKYVEPQILERINSHLGYAAVHRIKLHSGHTSPTPLPKKRPAGPAFPEESLEDIPSEDLRAALAALGRGVWEG